MILTGPTCTGAINFLTSDVCTTAILIFLTTESYKYRIVELSNGIISTLSFKNIDLLLQNLNSHEYRLIIATFKVITALTTTIAAFWDLAPCKVVDIYRCFGRSIRLHIHPSRRRQQIVIQSDHKNTP
jgi:hypothetical protein